MPCLVFLPAISWKGTDLSTPLTLKTPPMIHQRSTACLSIHSPPVVMSPATIRFQLTYFGRKVIFDIKSSINFFIWFVCAPTFYCKKRYRQNNSFFIHILIRICYFGIHVNNQLFMVVGKLFRQHLISTPCTTHAKFSIG